MVTLVRRAPTSRRALGSFVMCSGKSKFRTFSVKHGTCARFEMTAGGDVASGRRKGVRNICLNAKIGGNVECKKGARPWPTKFELASRSETAERGPSSAMLCRRTRFSRSAFGLRAEGRTSASEMGTTEDGKGRAGFAQRMEMLRLCAVSPETCQRGFVRVDRQRTALWPTRSKLALVKSGLWIQ